MLIFIIVAIVLIGAVALGLFLRQSRLAAKAGQQVLSDQTSTKPGGESGELYKIAESLQGYFDQSAHPKDLLAHAEFERGVKLLSSDKFSTADLLNYAAGTNGIICCMALEALARRDKFEEDIFDPIANLLPSLGFWPIYFAFRVLTKHTDRPLVTAVMARVSLAWRSPIATQILREFIEARVAAGEKPEFGEELN